MCQIRGTKTLKNNSTAQQERGKKNELKKRNYNSAFCYGKDST